MNQIEMITRLPNWRWKPHSKEEIFITGEELISESDLIWQIGKVAVVGFIYYSFTSPPWMWFVLAEGIRSKDLFDFRRKAELIPKGTLTAVQENFEAGMRFAKLYGFAEIEETQEYNGRTYKLMRKS